MKALEEDYSIYKIGLYIIFLFALLRPVTLMMRQNIIGLSLLEIAAIILSYMLLISFFLAIQKLPIDILTFLILFFCSYVLQSFLWGSELKNIMMTILPFVVYFSVRMYIKSLQQVNILLMILATGYSILIFFSFVLILMGFSVGKYEIASEVYRYKGVFLNIHTFSYFLLIFSFLYAHILTNQKNLNTYVKTGLLIVFIVSVFCLYKTYTRTAYIGFIIFWTIFLLGRSRKYFIIFLISLIFSVTIFHGHVEKIFWKTPEKSWNAASSGRLFLWSHNYSMFLESDLLTKLVGAGLGSKTSGNTVIGKRNEIWSSHSNFLGLLMGLGIIGLTLYLSIIFIIIFDVIASKVPRQGKFLLLGILASVTVMNAISNAFVFRIECSQLFWLFVGLHYAISRINEKEKDDQVIVGNTSMMANNSQLY
jgi:hypothetical protein